MQKHRKLKILALVLSVIFAFSAIANGEEPLYPIGTVNIEATSIAAGIGFSWGKGQLIFEGQEYPFKVSGLNIAAVGISEVSAIGDVYNLTKPSDLAGTYVSAEAGIAIAGGVKGLLAKNEKGVVLDLSAIQKGVSLNLSVGGFTITMQ